MQRHVTPGLIHYIRELASLWRNERRSDADLLAAFADASEGNAFTALVVRHGRVVWTTCRAVLANDADAEDAFQATFIALARHARRLRREPLEAWLRRVAHRAALLAARGVRRRARAQHQLYQRASREELCTVQPQDELQAVVREELAQLPEKLRSPVALYYFEGKTQAEVGRILGLTDRAVAARLEGALKMLRVRMERRGLVVASTTLAAVVCNLGVADALSPGMMAAAATTAVHALRGATVAGPAAAIASSLALPRVPLALVLAAVGTLGLGGAITVASIKRPPSPIAEAPASPTSRPATDLDPPIREPKHGPVVTFVGRILDAAGKPIPHADVTAVARRPFRAGDFGLREDTLRVGRADAQGSFRLTVRADFPTWYPDRKVVLVASAPGIPPTTLPVSISASQNPVELRLGQADPLRGILLDSDGNPAAGVQVSVVRVGDAACEPIQGSDEKPPEFWPKPVYSDEWGEYRFPGLGNTPNIWLQFRDDRFALSTHPGRSATEYPPYYFLEPARLLTGRVLAADTGVPLANARLAIYVGRWDRPYHTRHTVLTSSLEASRAVNPDVFDGKADHNGYFKLRLPTADEYRVDVFPAPGLGYLPLTRHINWNAGTTGRQEEFRLPRGVELRGRVVEAGSGTPVKGAYAYYMPHGNGSWNTVRDSVTLHSSYATSGADGTFRLAVPTGTCELEVHGPGWEYISQVVDPESLRPVPNRPQRFYANALSALDVPAGSEQFDVEVTLRRGLQVSGQVLGPDAAPARDCVFFCCDKVTPMRNRMVVPIPVRDGRFTLPGCEHGHTYPVLFLDAVHQCGALVDIPASMPNASTQPVRLQRCGLATFRVLDPDGRPAARRHLDLSVLLEPDTSTEDVGAFAARSQLADAYSLRWIDSINYGVDPVTDEEGWVTLPALVPGARYKIMVPWDDRCICDMPSFTVRANEEIILPKFVLNPLRGR
jgi:RNA polymerase sigma factor (sigma-70 family)